MGLRSISAIKIIRRNVSDDIPAENPSPSSGGISEELREKFEKISFQYYMKHPEEGNMDVMIFPAEQQYLEERIQLLLQENPTAGDDAEYYKFNRIPGFADKRIGIELEKSDLPKGIGSWEFLGILPPQGPNALESVLGSFYLTKDSNNPAITNLTFDLGWAQIAEEHPDEYPGFFRGLKDFLLRIL